MNFDNLIRERASIKNYSDKKVGEDKILEAIEAATLAPSPGNLSLLKFVIIEEPEKIDKIAQACQQPFISTAPVLVVICSDISQVKIMYDIRAEKYIKTYAGACIENFLLKITDMGLASCWVGAFFEPTIKSLLGIPEGIDVEAVLPVAYPAKADKTKQKPKPELINILYFENYGNKYKEGVIKIKR